MNHHGGHDQCARAEAELLALVASHERRLNDLRAEVATAWQRYQEMSGEVNHLRALAWEGWERAEAHEHLNEITCDVLVNKQILDDLDEARALAWEGWRVAAGREGTIMAYVRGLHEERDQAMAEAARINQCLGEMEDLERATRRERDQAMAEVARLAARVAVLERFAAGIPERR